MKKWQSSAVAAALVFSMFTVGCGEQIDQNAGIATSAPATEAATEATTAAPELTERAKKLLAQNPDTVENIVLYGHNMADNTMFGSLRQYRQNPSYYKEAPFITFSSNYADYTYVMVGLLITGGDADSDFKYWQMEDLDDKAAFDSYMGSVNSKNMIDNPIDVQYGDSLLTLSTCYSDEDNSRFLIVARRLRDGEDTASMLSTIQNNGGTDAAQE